MTPNTHERPPGAVVWLTGPPAVGKTTTARALLELLRAEERATVWLDSDDLRLVLTPEPNYTEDERDRFYGAIAHLARLAAEGGCVAVVSATAASAAWRERARQQIPRFCEVYLRCDPETLRARDFKGLYARAERGEISRLPGVGVPYDEPDRPELELDTGSTAPEVQARRILDWLNLWLLLEERPQEVGQIARDGMAPSV